MRNPIKAIALTALLSLTSPAYAVDLANMSDEERKQFGDNVRAYLLENPAIIIEAYQLYQEQEQAQEDIKDATLVASHLTEIQNDGYSWVGGNPDGDITLVEFLDYKCGYCRKAHDEVAELVASDGNIRLIVKEYPILSEDSINLSRAAIATLQSQGADAYKTIYNEFIQHNGPVTDESIAFIAKKAGLDGQMIIAKMHDVSVEDHMVKTRNLGEKLNVTGTPTFIFNDQIVRGYIPSDAMQEIIAELRRPTE
jgi:protein-disulfide isomerase